MEGIEENLRNYRLRRRRRERIREFKETIKGFLMLGETNKNADVRPDETSVTELESSADGNSPIRSDIVFEKDDNGTLLSPEEETFENMASEPESWVLKCVLRVVYFAFWVTLYIIAIELQFGIVFLMFSALAAIYLNTRTGPKKQNEISAYSVFNKNFESIGGTLKAEQFEREIGIR